MLSLSDGLREHWGSSCGSIPLGFDRRLSRRFDQGRCIVAGFVRPFY